MSEPEIGLAFTPDPWVEALHRYCSDHGGARVRALIVEPGVALEESFDVFVVGHRWPALTLAFVQDVHGRGWPVLGVCDREEPAARDHLRALGVDAVVDADDGEEAIVRAVVGLVGVRPRPADDAEKGPAIRRVGSGPVAIGGPPGTGRTEIAVGVAVAVSRHRTTVLVDADDIGPGVGIRLGLDPTPNICDAVDAVEHGRGDLEACVRGRTGGGPGVIVGLGHADGWSQVRSGEVCRVIDRVAAGGSLVIVDGAAPLDDLPTGIGRGRHATARALVVEASLCVGTFDPSPAGIARILDWVAGVRRLAPVVPIILVANRAPADRFRRREVAAAIDDVVPGTGVAFVPHDPRVSEAAWAGRPVAGGPFTRAVQGLAAAVEAVVADGVAAA